MKATPAQLEKCGFSAVTYEHSPGIFYIKRLKLSTMPRVKARVIKDVGQWNINENDVAAVEILPDGQVQLYVAGPDYHIDPVMPDSPEGRILLQEAGFEAAGQ